MARAFSVVIERDAEGYYVASVPELRGCHTQARSLDALMARIQEAIELCLVVGHRRHHLVREDALNLQLVRPIRRGAARHPPALARGRLARRHWGLSEYHLPACTRRRL